MLTWFAGLSANSAGYGANDAWKTMGILPMLLYADGKLAGVFHAPLRVASLHQAAKDLKTTRLRLRRDVRIDRVLG